MLDGKTTDPSTTNPCRLPSQDTENQTPSRCGAVLSCTRPKRSLHVGKSMRWRVTSQLAATISSMEMRSKAMEPTASLTGLSVFTKSVAFDAHRIPRRNAKTKAKPTAVADRIPMVHYSGLPRVGTAHHVVALACVRGGPCPPYAMRRRPPRRRSSPPIQSSYPS